MERFRGQQGFTIIEAIVTMAVLLIGLLGVVTMLDVAQQTTTSNKAREQGTSLQREIVENARALGYAQLTSQGIKDRLQSTSLADASGDAGWQVERRGITYTVSVGVCSVDDTSDKLGPHDAASFCSTGAGESTAQQCFDVLGVDGSIAGSGGARPDCGVDTNYDGLVDGLTEDEAGTGSCLLGVCPAPDPLTDDLNPDDYKRIVSLVRWDRGAGTRYALQSSTISYPGSAHAPVVTKLTTGATLITNGTSVDFTAETNRAAASVNWSVDGTPKGQAADGPTVWHFTWNIGSVSSLGTPVPAAGEIVDGPYVLAARAYDANQSYGPLKAQTIKLNRRIPFAPQGFTAGVVSGGAVVTEWVQNREKDIVSYTVKRKANGVTTTICTKLVTSCRDDAPPAGTTLEYSVVANDSTAVGEPSQVVTLTTTNNPPAKPTGLVCTRVNSSLVKLTWDAPSGTGDPDPGDAVTGYWVFRDTTTGDPHTKLGVQTAWTDLDATGGAHTYWLVAVDGQQAPSQAVSCAA